MHDTSLLSVFPPYLQDYGLVVHTVVLVNGFLSVFPPYEQDYGLVVHPNGAKQ